MKSRYHFIKELGRGGFGSVWLALDQAMGKNVALKLLANATSDTIDRFGREARILYRELNNKYIVDLLSHDLDASPPYIVLEYCDGGSLRRWVGEKNSWQSVAHALTHALNGLEGIHAAGGFHRDIKPDNLLLATDEDTGQAIVKVADFGLARVPTATSTLITQTAAGTQGYIAPEVLGGEPYHVGADIYSLGVVATELLCGKRDVTKLDTVKIPGRFRELILTMRSEDWRKRPTNPQVAAVLADLLRNPPAASEELAAARQVHPAVFVLGGVVLAGTVAAVIALAAKNKPQWDEIVQRYRRPDGPTHPPGATPPRPR